MYDEAKKDVMFIDFDYVSHAPIGVDIGNHFRAIMETALIDTGELDLKMFPNKEQQYVWLRSYITQGKKMGAKNFDQYEDCLEEIYNTLSMFCMIACLRWC